MKRSIIYNCLVWEWANPISGRGNEWILPEKPKVVHVKDGVIEKIEMQHGDYFLDDDEIAKFNNVIDAKGQLLLPGLIDSHIHVGLLGESQHYVNLDNCTTIKSLLSTISSHAEKEPDLPFIIGFNWDQSKLGRLPNRQDLDSLNIDKPIFLWRACWHIGVGNSLALQIGGIYNFSDPVEVFSINGGAVDVDAVGVPTGVLRERGVEPLIAAFAQHKSSTQNRVYLQEGLQLCVQEGITCVQTNDELCYSVYREMQVAGELPLRVLITPVHHELDMVCSDFPQPKRALGKGVDPSTMESRLGLERFKLFSDGSLGADTAALRLSSGDIKGMLIFQIDELVAKVLRIAQAGYRVEVHAIGDAAAEQVLQCFEQVNVALHSQCLPPLQRPILTHCQVLSPDIITHMALLGVVANVQPSFVPTDMRWLAQRLQPHQLESAYAWKTLLRQGVWVAGGSDAPVEHPSPFRGIHDAIFRSNYRRLRSDTGGCEGSTDKGVFREEERLNFSEALWLYSVGGAYCAGYEQLLGQVAVGFVADLVLVSAKVLMDFEELHDLKPAIVMVGGEVTHNACQREGPVLVKQSNIRFKDDEKHRPCYEENIPGNAPYIPGKAGSFALVGKSIDAGSGRPEKKRREVIRARCRCCLGEGFCLPISQSSQ